MLAQLNSFISLLFSAYFYRSNIKNKLRFPECFRRPVPRGGLWMVSIGKLDADRLKPEGDPWAPVAG